MFESMEHAAEESWSLRLESRKEDLVLLKVICYFWPYSGTFWGLFFYFF